MDQRLGGGKGAVKDCRDFLVAQLVLAAEQDGGALRFGQAGDGRFYFCGKFTVQRLLRREVNGFVLVLALRLVVVPQALRLITPPLTSQYLNIIKNSSLAVFVGYPDLVLVFAGTVLNQTHAAMQVMAVTMAVYLAISLVVSFALNLFDARNALKER